VIELRPGSRPGSTGVWCLNDSDSTGNLLMNMTLSFDISSTCVARNRLILSCRKGGRQRAHLLNSVCEQTTGDTWKPFGAHQLG
jgi:hypothetical protein